MPFTLSHPAAVLPLLRRPFGRAALVAGAVAPDMPYFVVTTGLPVSAQSWYEPFTNATTSHTALGAATASLPYTLALWALLRAAHRPLASLLPIPGPQPPPRTAGARARRAGWLVLSALIGITTHLAWDAFTHHDGFFVTHAPWLTSPLAGSLTWARALQHASTIGGLAATALYVWRRRADLLTGKARTGAGNARRGFAALAITLLTATGAVAHAWWPAATRTPTGLPLGVTVEGMLSDAAKGAGVALIGLWVLYMTGWWTWHTVTPARGTATAPAPQGTPPGDGPVTPSVSTFHTQ
ncbi:DUF4184 domain-containing protein [Streptomyces dioscori]|uniref:DUF4184 domain-containing protein n=1 Tax=Streptomyces dioscori TaxID=2109333 RepID=A0A2P8QF22_9ACTN|nr:DUF4184 family protein [Streptomyces dioscori]PSM44837.1 DUF4184 domain-containing protein [Streptomyces dioscori]